MASAFITPCVSEGVLCESDFSILLCFANAIDLKHTHTHSGFGTVRSDVRKGKMTLGNAPEEELVTIYYYRRLSKDMSYWGEILAITCCSTLPHFLPL